MTKRHRAKYPAGPFGYMGTVGGYNEPDPQSTVPVEPLKEYRIRSNGIDYIAFRRDEWDAARASLPVTAPEREATEQWVELFEAYNRGDDLRPIFDRHIEQASENIKRALAALPVREDEPTGIDVEPRSPEMNAGTELIAAERERQLRPQADGGEGWDADHDRGHADELALAAACYALPDEAIEHVERMDGYIVPGLWPWDGKWWKPKADDRVRQLVKAGALIAAAIDAELASRDRIVWQRLAEDIDAIAATLDAARASQPITATALTGDLISSVLRKSDNGYISIYWMDAEKTAAAILAALPVREGIKAACPATAREALLDGLARAYDDVKPEPGMNGPHGGHLGGVTRQRAATAIENAIAFLAALPVREDEPTGIDGLAEEIDRAVAELDRAATFDAGECAECGAPGEEQHSEGCSREALNGIAEARDWLGSLAARLTREASHE